MRRRSIDCFYYDDAVEGENYPPLHPNCRSCTIPYVEELKEYKYDNAIDEPMEKAAENEPLIREDLEAITKETGAELTGLEHSLKSGKSIMNKVLRDKDENRELSIIKTNKAILNDFHDNLRYTQVTKNANDLAGNIETTLTKLQAKGHRIDNIKNKWLTNDPENPYKDVMVQLTSPKGQRYELQFHDTHNLKLKEPLHEVYDKWRNEEDTILKQQYTEEMNEIAKGYVKPEGIERITDKNIVKKKL